MNQETRQERLKKYMELIAPEHELEAFSSVVPEDETENESATVGSVDRKQDLVQKAIKKLQNDEHLTDEESDQLEAIVHEDGRPAYLIQDDSYTISSGIWTHVADGTNKSNINAAIPNVGRIEMPGVLYVGTGFVVGDDLIMTNRHVADDFCIGLGHRELKFFPNVMPSMDFKREHDSDDSVHLVFQEVVMIHPYWDIAILRVEGLPSGRKPLQLATESPENMVGREIAVIGYPAKNSRQNVEMQDRIFNQIYNVKRLQPGLIHERQQKRSFRKMVNAMTHDSSTLGGNSGSVVFDFTNNKVVGVHFSGFELESNFAVSTYELARDSRVVGAGVNFDGDISPTNDWLNFWKTADSGEEVVPLNDKLIVSHEPPIAPKRQGVAKSGGGQIKLSVPLEITISLGQPCLGDQAGLLTESVQLGDSDLEAVQQMRIDPDPNYNRRRGYNVAFLGEEFPVPWPTLTDEQIQNTVENQWAERDTHLLHYHHFSLVMNAERKLAYYTACNIDGKREKHFSRDEFSDKWFKDPRIEDDEQQVNDLYKSNPLDRGHLVRRLDPVWGRFSTAKKAHDDTFHWTNGSPQHEKFNRNKTTWGLVENWILESAHAKNQRVTVFTGPVFLQNDPFFDFGENKRLKLPLSYWKIVAMVNHNDELVVTAFRINQTELISEMLEEVAEPTNFQTTVVEIERLTKLDFHELRDHDAMANAEEEGVETVDQDKVLNSFNDIVL